MASTEDNEFFCRRAEGVQSFKNLFLKVILGHS